MVITLIGLGETGTAIAQLLLNSYNSIQLNIMDPSDRLSGRIIDLSHAAVRNNNGVLFNDRRAFEESNFIFFCAGTRNLPNASRESMSVINKALIDTVFDGIKLKSSCIILVISNPLDAMVTWISHYFDNKLLVLGTGTLLDSWRLRRMLSERYRVPVDVIQAHVIGEHGESMVPVWSQTYIAGNAITEELDSVQLDELRLELLSMAKKIRETENATKYGVASVALDLYESLQAPRRTRIIASIQRVDESGKQQAPAIGRFIEVGYGKCHVMDFLSELTLAERSAFEESIKKVEVVVGSDSNQFE